MPSLSILGKLFFFHNSALNSLLDLHIKLGKLSMKACSHGSLKPLPPSLPSLHLAPSEVLAQGKLAQTHGKLGLSN